MNFKIGEKEILKAIESGSAEKVVIAKNAPERIMKKLSEAAKKKNIEVEINGDETQLATSLGKPFPVSSVAYCRN